ncbi:endonuclease VII [Streptomyces phage Enygma]|nr:HNH endonuclease [Streptomyces phage TomSawyer]URM87670.1 hypothetical protein SEA_QUARAN19_166 [Streptomyces phage Quaran19]
MKTCEKCSVEISVFSKFCPAHAEEIRKERDRNRKRQMRIDGAAYQKVKDAQARQREEKRQFVCEYLSSHPCVDCGESDIIVLEFDHTGDIEKVSDVSKMMNNGTSLSRMKEEIAKCEVRCCNCHRRKTVERRGETYRTKYLVLISPLPPKQLKE